MKKLKIFLLLSILLCFGFVLSFEVHAQGDGPKTFEVGDILPAGPVQIEFSYYNSDQLEETLDILDAVTFTTNNIIYFNVYIYIDFDDGVLWNHDGFIEVYTELISTNYSIIDDTSAIDEAGDVIRTMYAYIIIDFSNCTLAERTVSAIDGENIGTWEAIEVISTGYSITFEENGGTNVTDLTEQTALPNPLPIPTKENHTFLGWYYNSSFTNKAVAGDTLTTDVTLYALWGPTNTSKKFEEGDILPAGNIKISWDFTGKPIDVLHIFSILGDSEGDEDLNIEISSYGDSGSIIIIFINDNEFFVNEPGSTILTLTEPITIHSVEGYETYDYEPLDYYEYIDDALLWEVVSQDYTDGYEDGYAYAGVSYELGREHAREIYGYFDPITNQWLSVSEYLSLYGTDKMDQSDFYNNFDKYFIPAMIIVFGGAIVLTILKVFKGRE